MTQTHRARQRIQELCGIQFPRTPSWNDNSIYGLVLSTSTPRIDLNLFKNKENKSKVNLYTPPIVVRHDIKLNEHQQEAAKIDGRPSIIVGPAGCGKSVVLTQRIYNLINVANYSSTLRILVTTFNKQLTVTLGNWIYDLLEKKRIVKKGELSPEFYFEGSAQPNIRLMHFDILPTRIGGIKDNLQFDKFHENLIEQVVSSLFEHRNIERPSGYFLEPQFLLDEYHRVRYGLRVNSWEEYEVVERRGRKKPLMENQRRTVISVLKAYESELERRKISSIVSRRRKLLKQLESGHNANTFTHIFVDEFQDCTQADYAIFYGLLKDPNNITIAGDYAQAVHIGKSADSPRDDESRGVKMKNFKWHRLEGSYRLPYRISECIKPISNRIKLQDHEDSDIITPYKGSPPGARPILVYAESAEALAEKIVQIVSHYDSFEIIDLKITPKHRIAILEKDIELEKWLNKKRTGIAETDTILRLKGLEKRCVLWSTRIGIEHLDEVNNYVYTILTRTSGILIIALFDNTPGYYKEIIKELDRDRIILWDNLSKKYFSQNCSA